MAPNLVSEHFEENRTIFQGISLDYQKWAKYMDFSTMGGNENTRMFREVQALGQELAALGGETLGTRGSARAVL